MTVFSEQSQKLKSCLEHFENVLDSFKGLTKRGQEIWFIDTDGLALKDRWQTTVEKFESAHKEYEYIVYETMSFQELFTPTQSEKEHIMLSVARIKALVQRIVWEAESSYDSVRDNMWVQLSDFLDEVKEIAKQIVSFTVEVTKGAIEGAKTLFLPPGKD